MDDLSPEQLRQLLLRAGIPEHKIRELVEQVGQQVGLHTVFLPGSNPVFHISLEGVGAMNKSDDQNITVTASGDGSVAQLGSNQKALAHSVKSVISADSVNANVEWSQLRNALQDLDTPEKTKLDNAISDIETELKKAEPDKDEVGSALERALRYASKAGDFASSVAKTSEQLAKLVVWLGEKWQNLLGYLPLTG